MRSAERLSKPAGAFSPVPTAVPPRASARSGSTAARSSSMSVSTLARQPEISCEKRSGTASCRCVRPTFSTSSFSASSRRSVCAKLSHAGRRFSSSAITAAMCIAVGNVSFEDCDIFTSSFGCSSFFPVTALPRFATTSLTFMFDCVPLPVWNTTSGKFPSSCPARISSHAREMAAHFSSVMRCGTSARFASAAAFFNMAKARRISSGIVSWPAPAGKFRRLRSVCAPQYLSAGTAISPMESCSIRIFSSGIMAAPFSSVIYGRAATGTDLSDSVVSARTVPMDNFFTWAGGRCRGRTPSAGRGRSVRR